MRPYEHFFTLDISKNLLENAGGFDKNNWPLTSERFVNIYTYYGYQTYWQTGILGHTEKERLREIDAERLDRIKRERLRQAEAPARKM